MIRRIQHSGQHRGWMRAGLLFAGLLLAAGAALQNPVLSRAGTHSSAIPAEEFSRLIQTFSEEGGYFFSDNFTSNESAYIHILEPLKQRAATGGAYIGVGPEQNFTYIAKLRPEIAFIVDIRRQAIIQHLMYKAIFHLAPDRVQFLSILFSMPLTGPGVPKSDAPIEEILHYFAKARSSNEANQVNLSRIEKAIRQEFKFPLSTSDRNDLGYVFNAFWKGNLDIAFRYGSDQYGNYWPARFPTLADLFLATDEKGQKGNFLAREEDYQFVRRLHLQNRIIPVVGDFGGKKALAAVASYLRKNDYTLTAFYTSNVEQFLFEDPPVFAAFVENVHRMPLTDKSLIIRSVRNGGRPHPDGVPGHRMTPLLQLIPVFLQDYDKGLYRDYWRLITTHYIAPRSH